MVLDVAFSMLSEKENMQNILLKKVDKLLRNDSKIK